MGLKPSKKKLSKEDMQFLKKHTHFTERQIKIWYQGFMKDCPKGLLTKSKLMEVYSDLFRQGNPEAFCDHVFRTFDHDNSGHIDFKEFMLAISVTSAKDPKEKLTWAFTMYDKNKDGTIEKSEMVDIITAIYEMLGCSDSQEPPEERTEKIFKKMDVNNDGVLSREEFISGCLDDDDLRQMLTVDAICAP
ncbi:Frequenin-1,Neuronal calcium sensor 1,Neuron-specific calcium-binding protein hippocalcin,Hippocalcin-like protein 1,Neuronal calcium sensor 2,Visinin-like protein 1,Calcium-binding protein NCS-1,Neurocalcin homolog,Neurocalcin-delta A,Neurocalcin-delta B,Hippocalcin-like protein 4,Neurocalcin,Neurocalcin-delta [Acanthosepion pharaonis]|uniref:EF-hand domain-containing protein n=1 Tax=Acanthosepion pharaonis TaxID=158019 RepID=A0A812ERV3_ACAPH|nr:Frequenin-1,Neuronal calcium sensor 1,Neuron-specific calcium-binding protein hippocalcin,Hippocalcin-like protein 1,Neuronal calcium sensor 2,Visinin-like protein 1,Calcium-binding protein NCS-1,Neurocalcin homolog,Neurocalcin-delta A,Neurocalcin-delta B,Hippocalcin-like protein 4,Neurocalcin,Neurocalcin-delta [Sepia pharaonis]